MIEFEAFPKLPRLSRECVITEMIDGTNAQVIVKKPEDQDFEKLVHNVELSEQCRIVVYREEVFLIGAASRTRLIVPGIDNFGFAAWVWENAQDLVCLGPGRHFGEWYGKGLQRGYGLDHRRFALFNTSKWGGEHGTPPECCEVVPVLYQGDFNTSDVAREMDLLRMRGSKAVPGFMDPEGVVIYHTAANIAFKKTFDDGHKHEMDKERAKAA